MTFLTELIVAPMPDGRRWYLKQPLRWTARAGHHESWHEERCGHCAVEVPAGFVTDFASIPRLIWWFVSPWGKHGRAAVLHDFLYWSQTGSRRYADGVFLAAMSEAGQLLVVRYLMFSAVRLFGWLAWTGNEHDKAAGVNRVLEPGEIPGPDAVAPRRGLDRVIAVLCSLCNGGR